MKLDLPIEASAQPVPKLLALFDSADPLAKAAIPLLLVQVGTDRIELAQDIACVVRSRRNARSKASAQIPGLLYERVAKICAKEEALAWVRFGLEAEKLGCPDLSQTVQDLMSRRTAS